MRPGEAFVMNFIESAATSIVTKLLRRLDTGSVKAIWPELGALAWGGGLGVSGAAVWTGAPPLSRRGRCHRLAGAAHNGGPAWC
jgi:hypothetical protein